MLQELLATIYSLNTLLKREKMYNPTQSSYSLNALRKGIYAALITASCSSPAQQANIQGSLVEKLNTDNGQVLTISITNMVEGAETLGLKKDGEVKVQIPNPIPEPYSSRLAQCLTPATFGTYECDVDLEIAGREGQKGPYEVTRIHKINVNSPAEQLGDKASDFLKKGGEKAKQGLDWLRKKVDSK